MGISKTKQILEGLKQIVGGVSGMGAGLIIFHAISKVLPGKSNIVMKAIYGLGGAALADAVADVATKHMTETLDSFAASEGEEAVKVELETEETEKKVEEAI